MSVVLDAPQSHSGIQPGSEPGRFVALVVDDSPVERRLTGHIVEHTSDLRVAYATDGNEALAQIEKELPAVVLTDLHMPNMGGLELVEALRANYPSVPVVLMTSNGSEEIAIAALRAGAANYLAKRNLREELPPLLTQILSVARAERRRHELLGCITHLDCHFELENDPALVPLLVQHLQEYADRIGLCDHNGKIRLGVALEEALLNGIYHGNLEVSSELKQDGSDAFLRLAKQRRHQDPYSTRTLHVHAKLDPTEARFVIRDEGPGFDPNSLPDPTDPENLLRVSGRGLLLIRTFMDEAIHNAKGNQLTIVKRRTPELD